MVRTLTGIALSLAMLCSLPLAASAQTAPCISCAIARQNAAISAATNRVLVQQQLQSDLVNRLGTQQTTLQNQQQLSTMQLQSSLDQNDWALRQILMQEQLNLLQLQSTQPRVKAKPKKTRH
jgi:hypothetical protein